MARKGIREYDAKRMLATALSGYDGKAVLVGPGDDLKAMAADNPWLTEGGLTAKPDQLFGKRGKNGLVLLNKNLDQTAAWIAERMNTDKKLLSGVEGTLTHFIVEPFTPFDDDTTENYVSMVLDADGDIIYLSNMGGVDVEENWDQVKEIHISPLQEATAETFAPVVNELFKENQRAEITKFLLELYGHFKAGGYAYLEVNPFVVTGGVAQPLDCVAKVDDTAEFECRGLWGSLDYPAPFGQHLTEEEDFIREVDSKTGSSLKFTSLNPNGRIWNMVAGGGASVVYADTVCDLGYAKELAMYGEYSGNPNTQNTYQYARTVIDMMTRTPDPQGRNKYLLIGGGIANFTDVAKTFKGIIMALEEYAEKLKAAKVRVYVRRGGPNYQKGLADITAAVENIGIPVEAHGPESHMTQIVADALSHEG